MPRKNAEKDFSGSTLFHVYNRGSDRQRAFDDQADRDEFMRLVRGKVCGGPGVRLAARTGTADSRALPALELLAYAVLDTHFHLLLRQPLRGDELSAAMRSILTAYTKRFNTRHGRHGPLWESPYRARPITGAVDQIEVTAYIHLNPPEYRRMEQTSHPNYLGVKTQPWLHARDGLKPFGGTDAYKNFVDARTRIRATRQDAARLEW